MIKCKQGINWDCDFINAQIKVTAGCRAEVNMMGQVTRCGEGGGKDEEYICPVPVDESIETYCGFPSTKIKLRAQDITGRYKNTPTACNCQELCMGIGADAWMFNLDKGLCQCRSVTEEKNRATFNLDKGLCQCRSVTE